MAVKNILVNIKEIKSKESTDLALSIRTSDEEINKWDRNRIIDALLRETNVEEDLAEEISKEVEEQIFSSRIKTITTSLVRELVNAKLIENGLEKERLKHNRLGIPIYDIEQMLLSPNKENANVPHGPESTNLTIAGSIKKDFFLEKVFSKEVTNAHVRGDMHIHDLSVGGDRPYCSGQSLEYVKKFGLNLPKALSIAKPATNPEVLLAHMVKFAAALQCHFAGAIGWDAVNVFFAPYLVNKNDKEIKQLAQMLIYEFSQQAVARGGQSIFSDINLYWEIPEHFKNTPAIGPGGKYTGKKYKDYIKESQKFAKALFEVYKEGDSVGRPFFFPKPLCLSGDTEVFVRIDSSTRYEKYTLKDLTDFHKQNPSSKIAILDADIKTGKVREVPVKSIGLRQRKEKMIRFNLARNIKLDSIPEHTNFILKDGKIVRVKSKDISIGHLLVATRNMPENLEPSYMDSCFIKLFKPDLKNFKFISVKDIKTIENDSYTLEVDHSQHSFLLSNSILTSNCHITEELFRTPDHKEYLNLICLVAAKMGNPYFVFDRGSTAKISECCRLSFKLTDKDLDDAKEPWRMRYCALQNVTINLPRIGYLSKGDKVFDRITKIFNLTVKAHLQKYRFIKKLLSLGNYGPLALLVMDKDGDPYLKLDKVSYLIGMVGLNELVKSQKGCEMHESKEAFKYGLSIISHMKLLVDKAVKEHDLHFVLEQSPAESTAHRFARVDLKYYPEKAREIVQGNLDDDSVYYTNSTQLNIGADVSPADRVLKEGLFHPLIEAGSLCLDYHEQIPVYERDSFKICKIGDFVEQHLENATSVTKLLDGTIQVPVSNPAKTTGLDNKGGKLVDITHVTKVPVSDKKMYKIITQDHKSIKVTEKHKLFKLENGLIKEVESQNIYPKDTILTQSEIFNTNFVNQINVLNYLHDSDNITIIDDGSISKYLKDNSISFPHSFYKNKAINLTFLRKNAPKYPLESHLGTLKWRCRNCKGSLPFIFDIDYDFGLLLGFFLAEGHCFMSDKTRSSSIGFTLHRIENEFARIIKHLFLKVFNKELLFKRIKNWQTCSIHSNSIYYLFSTIFNVGKSSFSKKIPKHLFILNKDYLKGIIDGCFSGDGLKANKRNWTNISLTSSKLITQLQLICTILGIKFTKISWKPVNLKSNKVHCLYIGNSGFKKLLNNTSLYKKYLKNTKTLSKIDRELISPKACPFKSLYNKYLKSKSYIFVNRKKLINLSRTRRFCVSTAIKFTDEWINFLISLKSNSTLLGRVFVKDIAKEINLNIRTLFRILKMLEISKTYVKNNYYSNNVFETVKNYNFDTIREDINKDINNLLTFKYNLETFSYAIVDSVTEYPSESFAYDITVEGHKFSNLDGIVCHNTHIWLGEAQPDPSSLASFVKKVFYNTKNDQIAFSPEFTCCNSCDKVSRGLLDSCPYCNSKNIEGITRITGYFSKITGWNRGKLAELKNRKRTPFD